MDPRPSALLARVDQPDAELADLGKRALVLGIDEPEAAAVMGDTARG